MPCTWCQCIGVGIKVYRFGTTSFCAELRKFIQIAPFVFFFYYYFFFFLFFFYCSSLLFFIIVAVVSLAAVIFPFLLFCSLRSNCSLLPDWMLYVYYTGIYLCFVFICVCDWVRLFTLTRLSVWLSDNCTEREKHTHTHISVRNFNMPLVDHHKYKQSCRAWLVISSNSYKTKFPFFMFEAKEGKDSSVSWILFYFHVCL